MKQQVLTITTEPTLFIGAPACHAVDAVSSVSALRSFHAWRGDAVAVSDIAVVDIAVSDIAVVDMALADMAIAAANAPVANAAIAVVAPAAMANLRAEFGRNAAAAHAWDTTGGAPSFQANKCTKKSGAAKTRTNTTHATKTHKTTCTKTYKTKKRPSSWSGPPNG
jgi:hypothetical protein